MDFASLGIASVAAITVVCYLIGMAVKASGLNDKWIPVIMGVCGLVLGVVGMFIIPDYPAQDYITSALWVSSAVWLRPALIRSRSS